MDLTKPEPLISHYIDIVEPIIIADTNVLLDYIEKRNKEVYKFVNNLIKLSRKQILTIGTTIYNISEVLDKELEIKFQLELLKNRYSADEIIRYARNRSNYPKNIGKLNGKSKLKLFGSLSKSVIQLLDDFVIFHLNDFTKDDYEILEELITEEYLQSQDALIV